MSKAIPIICLVLLGAIVSMALPHVGGLGDERPADEEVRKIVSSVDKLMKEKYPTGFASIEPISFKTQLVAGTNYFVRAIVTEIDNKKKHVHMRIYKPIHGQTELTAIKTDVDKDTPLRHFQ